MNAKSQRAGNLKRGLWSYGLIQLAQWITYASIFKILLQNSSNAAYLAPVYVGLLALARTFSSVVFGRRWLVESRRGFEFILWAAILLTGVQELFVHLNWSGFFLIATAVKLGSLVVFQVWRDVISIKLSKLGVTTANLINSQFGMIDFGTMAIGAFVGGALTSTMGPEMVIWFDAVILGVAVLILRRISNTKRRESVESLSGTNTFGFRPIGLIGHGIRSFSDAGFQSILPIIAYQVIKMDSSLFGLSIAISGLMITLGAHLAARFPNKLGSRTKYGILCFAATVINALCLWLCFSSQNTFSFIFWLGAGSLAAGIAMVTTRTIVLSDTKNAKQVKRDGSFYFNTIRWFGLGFGALLLAWGLSNFSVLTLGNLSLISMMLSGGFLWASAYEGQKKAYNIGHRMHEIMAATLSLLFVALAFTSYFVLQQVPREQRLESRKVALAQYVSLVELNMRVSDLSEVIRLTRGFQYPEGTINVLIKVVGGDQVILEEVFSHQTKKELENSIFEAYAAQDKFMNISRVLKGTLSAIYRYEYLLPAIGPGGADLQLSVSFDDTKASRVDFLKNLGVTICALLSLSLIFLVLRQMTIKLLLPLDNVVRKLQEGLNDSKEKSELTRVPEELAGYSLEVQKVVQTYNSVLEKNMHLHIGLQQIQTDKKLHELASQVAHDIRSPLAALDVVFQTLPTLPDDSRNLIRQSIGRIRDIGNTLLKQKRGTHGVVDDMITPELLVQAIESLVSEKRSQFAERPGLNVEAKFENEAYGIFCKLQLTEFKRVLSNLVNNAAEAIKGDGRVTISLRTEYPSAVITVSDTGGGIPPEIVARLGNFGETHGKEDGNGIGLHHAFQAIQKWNGRITIDSELGHGTHISIFLPLAETPKWFASELGIDKATRVIVVDDNSSIHLAWDKRLASIGFDTSAGTVEHFYSYDSLRDWLGTNQHVAQNDIFLVDYEFVNSTKSGIDIIVDFNLISKATLITSRFEEAKVRESCLRHGIKIMPKSVVPFVQLRREVNGQQKFGESS